MAPLSLFLYLLWLLLTFVLRAVVQRRRTGDSGFRGISGRPGSVTWWAGVLFVLAIVTGLAAPVAQLAGLDPPASLRHGAIQATGLVTAILGGLATLAAQAGMGDAWRVGVEETEQTPLVTSGAFARIRNPVFTAMVVAAAGLALMTPNAVAAVAVACLVAAVWLQVRHVEEPYLRQLHGHRYDHYAARTGRFLPRVRDTGRPSGRKSRDVPA